jgi:hypothetical protein
MTRQTGKIHRMLDAVFNLLFHCSHRHLTRPFTPLGVQGVPRRETYVVCLDCTRQFAYDWTAMRVGKAIYYTHDACVIPPDMAGPRKSKLAYPLGVAVSVAVLAAAALKTMRPAGEK